MRKSGLVRQPEGLSGGGGEVLPAWNLNDLYAGVSDPAIVEDLAAAERDAAAFEAAYRMKLAGLDGAALAAAVRDYERIEEVLGRVMSFAQLLFSADSSDPAVGQFYQTMSERATVIGTHLLFFVLELNLLGEDDLAGKLRDPALARYAPWLRDLRVFLPHQLSPELEKLLHEKEVTGHSAWSRLFDETMTGLRIPFGTETLTLSDALNKLSDPDREIRRLAGGAVGAAMAGHEKMLSLITNTLAKDKEIIDDWRHYPTPPSARNRSNMVEDEVVAALSDAVVASYPKLAHRYYSMKAEWLGLEKLEYWDRNAPLPGDGDRTIGWNEARARVLDAYGAFTPELAEAVEPFFARGWIDAGLRPGKSGGAFAHSTVPSVHPYVLMNYHGRTRDVMTLAHELGHGAHQVLAGGQGYLMAGTPLTLAETASVFGEMLTFRALLARTRSIAERRAMLSAKVEDMINTVVRQIAFYTFERKLHLARREGELTSDQISEIWMSVQAESLGPAIRLMPGYETFWAYIPHFIHSPFYVYAYAFGDCLVNSLYGVFEQAREGFAERYLAMLSAGGTKHHSELLAPFGLDATDPAFWQIGLGMIEGMIAELEAME